MLSYDSNDFVNVFEKNGVILQKSETNPTCLFFRFSMNDTLNKDKNIIHIIKENQFFEVFKLANPTLVKTIEYIHVEESDVPDCNQIETNVVITISSKYNNAVLSQLAYEDDDDEDEDDDQEDDDDFVFFSSNRILIFHENHVQIKKLQTNDINIMADVVKHGENTVDFLLGLELNTQLNIVKENLLVDIIQDSLFHLKNYLS